MEATVHLELRVRKTWRFHLGMWGLKLKAACGYHIFDHEVRNLVARTLKIETVAC